MKVGIIATSRFPMRQPFPGGLEAHADLLRRSLVARGHDVTVFAGRESDPSIGVVALSDRPPPFSEAGRQDVSSAPGAFLDEHHAYLDLMTRISDYDLDVVHNNSLHYLPIAMAAASPPMVTTLHCPPTPWLESAIDLAWGRVRPRLVSVSDHNAAAWPRGVDTVIPNGIDLTAWPMGQGDGGYAVWTGRFVAEKAPHLAIRAARAAGIELVLAGPRHDREYFDTCIAPELGHDVVYAGHLDGASTAALVGRARVALATPMWDEPFGLVVAEATACGTPVAAFGTGALPGLVDGDTGRLAPPGDVAGLARCITEARDLDRSRCRRHAERWFDAEVMVDRYLDEYDLARGRATP